MPTVEIDSVCSTMIKSRAGSIKRYGVRLFVCLCVRPSVCPSVGPQQQTRCCRFTGVGPAGKRYRSIAAAAAGECGQCHVVSVRR